METVIMNKIKNKYYATFMVVTIILTAGFVLAANAYEPKCYTGQGAGGNISCGSINSVGGEVNTCSKTVSTPCPNTISEECGNTCIRTYTKTPSRSSWCKSDPKKKCTIMTVAPCFMYSVTLCKESQGTCKYVTENNGTIITMPVFTCSEVYDGTYAVGTYDITTIEDM